MANTLTFSEFTPGSFVVNENKLEWGVGQIQSSIKEIVTVNFENVGKKVINIKIINLNLVELK